jgi:hypothetical protein
VWLKQSKQYRIRNKGRIDFKTDVGEYRIWVYYEVVNTYSAKSKGISYLSIYNNITDEKGPFIEAKPAELFDF